LTRYWPTASSSVLLFSEAGECHPLNSVISYLFCIYTSAVVSVNISVVDLYRP